MTRLEDAQLAVDAGAWAIGMILWPGSKRVCDLGEAQRISNTLRRRVEIAGVFVNQSLDEVTALAETLNLSLVQLHGDEGPSYAHEIARRTGAKVIKAQAVRLGSDVVAVQAFHTDFHLLDAFHEELRGGTGETFDWSAVSRRRSDVPLILSGGLTPDNVAEAIRRTRPFAVDVASGVESAPGIKDPEKLVAFAAAVRSTADEPEEAPRGPGAPASATPSAPSAGRAPNPPGRGTPVRPPSTEPQEAPTA